LKSCGAEQDQVNAQSQDDQESKQRDQDAAGSMISQIFQKLSVENIFVSPSKRNGLIAFRDRHPRAPAAEWGVPLQPGAPQPGKDVRNDHDPEERGHALHEDAVELFRFFFGHAGHAGVFSH
jgi:hypothetical protein